MKMMYTNSTAIPTILLCTVVVTLIALHVTNANESSMVVDKLAQRCISQLSITASSDRDYDSSKVTPYDLLPLFQVPNHNVHELPLTIQYHFALATCENSNLSNRNPSVCHENRVMLK